MYSYEMCEKDIKKWSPKSAGKSLLGRELFYFTIGEGRRKVFFNAAHHGLEYITSALLLSFAEYIKGKDLDSTLYIMPMVNPDGVDIAQNLITSPELIELNGGKSFFKNWQANARGVDLNHNYNAAWGRGNPPGPTRCGGDYPESEPETKAVADLVRSEKFDMMLCFHSQGEVIYHGFGEKEPYNSLELGKKMSIISGYELDKPEGFSADGGCKDWFVNEFDRIGYTIEVGLGKNPLPFEQLGTICLKTFSMMEFVLTKERI